MSFVLYAIDTLDDLDDFVLGKNCQMGRLFLHVDTGYKVAILERKTTLYADLLNNRPKFTLEGHIRDLIKRFHSQNISGDLISCFYCIRVFILFAN